MNTRKRKLPVSIKTSFLSALFVTTVVSSAVTSADDTEIYFSEAVSSGGNKSNVMFMLDTSGSMNNTDDLGIRRIDRLKSAMYDVLNFAEDVNVGISTFGGHRKGGTIRYPATNLEKDTCPSASCTSLKIRNDILHNEDDGAAINDGGNKRVDLSSEVLDLGDYSSSSNENQTIWALRFDGVDVPRGADINLAQFVVSSTTLQRGDIEFIIAAEDTGHSLPLVNDNYDQLVSRFDSASGGTNERITWSEDERWNTNRPYYAPDIKTVIEAVTNRADWCGGNALTLLIKTEGTRDVHSRDGTTWQAPALHIDYDPSSVDWTDTCLSLGASSNIADGGNDVVENVATGTIERASSALSTVVGGDEQTVGLRFSNVSVPPNATITSSYIEFASEGFDNGTVNLAIRAEDTDNAAEINAAALSLRNYHAQTVFWNDVPALASGSKVQTPSLDQLMTSVVNTPGWISGNQVLLTLSRNSGSTGARFFSAHESSVGAAARLVVNYRRNSAELAGSPPVLSTARAELIDTVLEFQRKGNTPLIDAYLETAQYMRGAELVFGSQRGVQGSDDAEFRLSTPSSYEGASGIFRPANCREDDLNGEACVFEEITGSPNYIQPEGGSCAANHIVLLTDGASSHNSSTEYISGLIGESCDVSHSRSTDNCGVDLAEWLVATDHDAAAPGMQSVVTHTVGFNVNSSLLQEMAKAGEGEFFTATSASDLITAFNSVLETSVTGGPGVLAPTTTISLDNRLLNSNDLFYAMFSPSTRSHWNGNVKRFQLGLNGATGQLEVQDSNGVAALGNDGVLTDTSRSFWSASDDGPNIVEGGAASRQRLARDIYTSIYDAGTGSTQLLEFHEDTAEITNDLLGIGGASAQSRESLLQWARGVDIRDIDDDGNTTEVRAQMGDPLHSSQLVLEYADGGGRSMLFVGTNHGFLHAIDTETGIENFAYIPDDLLDVLDPVFQNTAQAHGDKTYGLDGEIVGWHNDTNENSIVDGNDTAYIYFGMRRGGNNYYALNVTDPDNPELLWTIEGGVGDFAELGQTWSRPIKSTVNYLGSDRDVLFFAGGYDPANDGEVVRTADSVGRAIYMVDATTGQLLLHRDSTDHPSMVYSIPSDMRIVNPDGDAYANAIYVGDTGGQVWRFDINNFATSDADFLTGTVLASFGGATASDNRQFFNEPDIAFGSSSQNGLFLNVAIGSGARPNPNNLTTEDTFYSIKDPSVFGPPRNANGDIVYPRPLLEADIVNVTGALAENVSAGNLDEGWFFRLITDGEKSMSSALTLNNEIFFTTYIPATSSVFGNSDICSPSLGSGRVYQVNLLDGSASGVTTNDVDLDRYRNLNQVGIPPRVVAVIAEASPDVVATFVGMEPVGNEADVGPFERVFWAER